MPSNRSTRQSRHMAQVKQTSGSAQKGRKVTENVPGSGYRESQYIGGKKYYSPLSTDPDLSITGGTGTTINVSGGGGLNTQAGVTVHQDLSGLDTDDHPNYVHLGNQRTITAAHIFTADVVFTGSPQFADLDLSDPVNIYNLQHDSFAGFVPNEHLDWTNATADFVTTGTIGTGAATFTSVKSPTITTAASTAMTINPTTSLSIIPGTGGIVIGANGNQATLSTQNFAPGFTGGGIQLNGINASISATDMTIRGTLSVYELLIQQVRATNGSIFVSSTGKVATVTSQTSITFEDPSDHGVTPFAVNDILLAQRVQLGGSSSNSSQIIKRVFAKVTALSGLTATLAAVSGAPSSTGSIEIGDDFVRIGNTSDLSRQGGIYLTADDSGAPFIDVFSGVSSYATWNSSNKIKARLGRLDGIADTDAGLSGSQTNHFGLYSDNVHLKGHLFSDSGNIGGWDISATAITSTVTSVDRLILEADGDIHIMSYTSGGSTRHGLFLYEHGGTSASDWWTIFHDDDSTNDGEFVFNYEGNNKFKIHRDGTVNQPSNTEFLIHNNTVKIANSATQTGALWYELNSTDTAMASDFSMGGIKWYNADSGAYGGNYNATIQAVHSTEADGRLGLRFRVGGDTTATDYFVNFEYDGDVRNGKNSANWDYTSDIRVKTDIETVSGAVNIISSLIPISYNFKEDFLTASHLKDKKRWGFSAQDLKTIIPEAVTTAPGYGYEDFHSLNTDMLVPILVAAVKELKAEIDALKE